MVLKRVIKGGVALTMSLMMFVMTPVQTYAATETANSYAELASIIRTHLMESRDAKFDVKTAMDIDEVTERMFTDKSDVIDGMISMLDDPTTTEDADFIVGNVNWPKMNLNINDDLSIHFDIHMFETMAQTQYVNQHAPEILASLGVANMTNYEKVKAIHDWIGKQNTYTSTDKDSESTTYGVIHDGKALCNGYSLCFYKLCVEAGIPCKYIGGKAGTGRDAGGHAWNIVALGDKWYNVDMTWDDEDDNDRVVYDYFLKGKRDFDEYDPTQKHTVDYGYSTFFAEAFPVADTAFNPTVMSDVNTTIKIGSTLDGVDIDAESAPSTVEKEIVDGSYPSSMKFSVKRNKRQYLQLFIAEGMEEEVSYVIYKVPTGKKRIKSIINDGVVQDEDDGSYFTNLSFKGKKKGKVTVKITLVLTDYSERTYTFTGKVK